jgi:hypothetical protein
MFVRSIDVAAGQNTTFFIIRPPHAGGVPPATETAKPAPAAHDSGWGFSGAAAPAPVEPAPTAVAPTQVADPLQPASDAKQSFSVREAWDSLNRFPPIIDPPEHCAVCHEDKGEDAVLIECMKCEVGTHIGCLDPPRATAPDGTSRRCPVG